MAFTQQNNDYYRMADAIAFLVEHQVDQPSLADVAKHVKMSESQLQRVFSRWVGVSPKRFLQFLTKEYAKQQLNNKPVLEAAMSAGLSSGGRLHDLMIACEAITPGEYKQQAAQFNIAYDVQDSPWGRCFMAVTKRGICKLAFCDSDDELLMVEQELYQQWHLSKVSRDADVVSQWMTQLFSNANNAQPLHVSLKGTNFQLQVWQALLSIPEGRVVTYSDVAEAIGKPKAVRAVASAVANNTVAYLIPCHRVIRKTGAWHQYRWGKTRKQLLLGKEFSLLESDARHDFE